MVFPQKLLRDHWNGWRLRYWQSIVASIDRLEPRLQKLTSEELLRESLSLQYRAKCGELLDDLLVEAYALVREAASRSLQMRHYSVQILGGIAMHHGCIAEMQTGEGKTLTATLPAYLNALTGRGVHIATANDYLAARDAELMLPVYSKLGLSVGVIQQSSTPGERIQSYQRDITYTTAKELGFDFLRERIRMRQEVDETEVADDAHSIYGQSARASQIQRELNFALIDEADAILIDEARTPLIVSSQPGADDDAARQVYYWAAKHCSKFANEEHFGWDLHHRNPTLNATGRRLVRELPTPEGVASLPLLELYEAMERAILVDSNYQLNRHYVILNSEVTIVDELTGRLADGRKWRGGIHQAIEAKEGLKLSWDSGQAARVTIQNLFRKYERIGGMTGTAANSETELRQIFRVDVVRIPTNRPPKRKRLDDRFFVKQDSKWQAVVQETKEIHAQGRPVLIGTRSIDKSMIVSDLLRREGLEHSVLNACHVEQEAEIVARAGLPGAITVATNMAGRGTDIRLGPGVEGRGGLHVICTEMHESERIDRQLIGRCGRQGDSGSYRFLLAVDDDLLVQAWGEAKAAKIKTAAAAGKLKKADLSRIFARSQRKVETQHFKQRRSLMFHERERHKLQEQMGQDPYLDSPV